MLQNTDHFSYKIIVLGDASIGKTSLSLMYTQKTFPQNSKCTIGVDYRSKNIEIDDIKVKLNIFDTAGQQTYRSIVKNYYNQVDAAIFAYDITSKKSFENLSSWLKDFYEKCNNEKLSIKILVGTKCDLQQSRQVKIEQAKHFMDTQGFLFSFETSAKRNIKIDEVFQQIARNLLLKTFKQKKSSQQTIRKDLLQMLGPPPSQKDSKCC